MTQGPINISDRTTAYALMVLDGKIVAGPHVRDACKRHVDDLINGAKRGLIWDLAAADRAIDFFPDCMNAEVDGETVPFPLLDWQIFCTGAIFGWKMKNGFRRFNVAYIEGGKGCGKSPWAAGVGMYMLIVDKEKRAEVYSCGAKLEQARILFDDAVSIVNNSDILMRNVAKTGRTKVTSLSYRPTNSIFKPMSSDKMKSGIRVYCALVDELHEHKDRYVVDQMKFGFKGRRQPLMLIITNAGFDKESVCYEYHDHAIAVAEGVLSDDRFFSYVMALDIGDDPFTDRSCWPKTNPGLGTTIQESYLEDQVRDAIQIPGRENLVRRLNFCEWTDADEGWMTRQAWMNCEEDLVHMITPKEDKLLAGFADLSPFEDAECCVALDLAYAFDMVAIAYNFKEGANHLSFVEYMTPGRTLADREKRDRVPYAKWRDMGLIHCVDDKVVRKRHVAARLAYVRTVLDIKHAAFDRYAHKELAMEMADEGVDLPWIEHPQGFRRGGTLEDMKDTKGNPLDNPLWMPDSVNRLETRIIDQTLRVQPSQVTRWQVSSVVVRQDPAGTGGRIFNKMKSTGRIDGVVAMAMAEGAQSMVLPARSLRGMIRRPIQAHVQG